MKKYDLICEIALKLGKKKQDLANWNFAGSVPRIMRFDIYVEAKKQGVELTSKDFDNFKK